MAGLPPCGNEWQAPGERYVLAKVPPADSPEMGTFIKNFLAALQATNRKPAT